MKKRGMFWLIEPAALAIVGFIVAGLNSLTDANSGLHMALNLLAFLCMGVGVLAFIPGLIYGIVLLNKK